jgi:hypothetical protein
MKIPHPPRYVKRKVYVNLFFSGWVGVGGGFREIRNTRVESLHKVVTKSVPQHSKIPGKGPKKHPGQTRKIPQEGQGEKWAGRGRFT